MGLVEWSKEPIRKPEKKRWDIAVRKHEYGSIVIEAVDEEAALEEFYNIPVRELNEQVEWVDWDFEYDSCGGVSEV